ncbi:hypothetical protein GCM10009847_21600 [Leucobacter tardus]|uniref:Alpha-ketoglutarate decarboxylase n=1 Tax=Leucobacter tardus TaxID=501483 RepID=A0A939TKJ3_9MICO|nr:alpha-ketoglutarate decarboxylase [Leucobacter tardus]MBO2990326.1 alpha-ketoglutarate decarboxylase [Leucobacter tardus]
MTENECAQARANIEELIRGEQCAGQREALMRHLDECDDCRSEEQVCQRLTEAVKRACAESAPQSLREAIRIGLRDLHRA